MSRTTRINGARRDGKIIAKPHQGFKAALKATAMAATAACEESWGDLPHPSFLEDWLDPEYDNWKEFQLLNRTIYDDGLVKLQGEVNPGHQPWINLDLTTWWGNHYVGRDVIPLSSIKGVTKAFKAFVTELKSKEVEIPFWIGVYDEDGRRDYRVSVYKKLGFVTDPDDPDLLIFWT